MLIASLLISDFSVLYERYPRWFACLRGKRRLILNDTDDQSVYDDVESRRHSFQACDGGFQSNDRLSFGPESAGGSTESLRSTSSIAWSSVTYFESGRRNSDSAFTYYSVPPCYIVCGGNRCRRVKSLDNLYENAHTDFGEHEYYDRIVKGRNGVPEYVNVGETTADSGGKSPTALSDSGDSACASSLGNTQNQVPTDEENVAAKETSLNCGISNLQNDKEATDSKITISNENHCSSSEEPNTKKSIRGSRGIARDEDEYNALGVLDATTYSVENGGSACDEEEYKSLGFLNAKLYSEYCFPIGTNDMRQERGGFLAIASSSSGSLDRRSSVQEYDVMNVAKETCCVIEPNEHGDVKEYSGVAETGGSSGDEYTFLGHVACTSYNTYDKWINTEEEDDEYATIPDKECSELDSICSIGSVGSIGSVESIGSVNSVFSSFGLNSSSDVESVLELDEAENGTNCNEPESVYDEIGSINENPFSDDSKEELEKDYEMCSMKSMCFEEDFKFWKNKGDKFKATETMKNADSELQNGQFCPEDEAITEAGDFEMKTLRDDNASDLNLDTKENYFSEEANHAHLGATNNVHGKSGQQSVSKTELLHWNKLYDEIQKNKSFSALRKMLLQGKDEILRGFLIPQDILIASQVGEIDDVAMEELPSDAPEGLVPVAVSRDGNCFTRAISMAIYGTEEYHKILRTKILMEGVVYKYRYLNEDYLRLGMDPQQNDKILSCIFAEFSGNYKPEEMNPQGRTHEEISNTVKAVYKRDILEVRKLGAEMGMWQIFQASNVLGRPIASVFPERGNPNYRNYFNRIVYPWNKEHRRNPCLAIMWTPSKAGGPVNHFVPLLPP